MANYPYIVPIAYVLEDNETYVAKRSFFIKDCSVWGTNQPENCSIWSSEKCSTDPEYCQPYVVGDKIYLQFPLNPNSYSVGTPHLIDITTGDVVPGSFFTLQSGMDDVKTHYLNIVVNTSEIASAGVKCWQVQLELHLADVGPPVGFSYTEPWCEVKCGKKTVMIEGTYTKYDCANFFYGVFSNGQQSLFKRQVRVYGEVVSNGFNFSEVLTGKTVTKSTTQETFTFWMKKMPPYVAEQIALCFGGQALYIDAIKYNKPQKISKDFDEGYSWIPKVDLSKDCDEINFTCE